MRAGQRVKVKKEAVVPGSTLESFFAGAKGIVLDVLDRGAVVGVRELPNGGALVGVEGVRVWFDKSELIVVGDS